MRVSRRGATVGLLAVGIAGLGLAVAGPASAHVTASAGSAVQGGYTTITFNVPTESATASTIGLAVALPTGTPIASVSVQPKTGWTYTVKKGKPSTPLSDDDGAVTSVVTEIDWKASAGTGIKPGEFDTFVISAGPLPKTPSLKFPAIQTYSDGSTVKWIEAPAPGSTVEPAHPAPTITLAAASASNASAATSSGNASSGNASASGTTGVAAGSSASKSGTSGLAVAALIVGVIGMLLAAAAGYGVLTVRRELRKGLSVS
ncbi:MAG TPA: YcnI family protein [Jatrophihabitans sp.]